MKNLYLYSIFSLISIILIFYGCSTDKNNVTGSGSGPAAPGNLTSSVPAFGSVQLTWTDNSGEEDGFKIERSINSPTSWSQIGTVGTNSTSYLDTGLTGGSTYYYRVYAYNSSGNSDPSNTVSEAMLVTDPDVLIFNNLVVQENNGNGGSPSAINLLSGRIDSAASNNKDVTLVDLAGNGTDFYFRSGDLSFLDNISPGYKTEFGQFIEWQDITHAEWDTLSRIWKSSANADTVSPVDFQGVDTRYPSPNTYFGFPLTANRVYAFYLSGKYNNGVTPERVYGMLYLDDAQNVGGSFPYRLTVDVKLNIGGRNQFLKEVPIQ